ncbi:alpha/beta hydrolase [Salimicrobium flavidum]|uniref:Serine aminopeptidase, S33 n=1 Tax=Salimicrobium flavidum TaxID=570947 RepID=A0A1N7J3S1_9BACI|nr:alpha/beta hydrolase [Salimicrobium flavidum]SIS43990.1 Serine aminopeptidase, S33 [Salimicrobium flavidum]
MKKTLRILVIFGLTSVVIYLGLAYGFVFFSEVKKPSGDRDNLNFERLETTESSPSPLKKYEAVDGTELHYRHYESDAERTLILLHGSGYHSDYLETLARNLADEGVATVFTPDFRGHGESVDKRGDVKYVGQLERDMHEFIQMIKGMHPEQPLILGGHSSGGGTVIRMAGGEYSPEAVDGYLLLAPYIHHEAPTNNSEESGWANVNVQRMIGLSMLNNVGITHLNDKEVISFNMPNEYRDGTETLAYSYRMQISMHPRDDYKGDITSMNEDTLVLAGSEDESFNSYYYQEVFAEHDQSHVRLVEGLSHFGILYDENVFQIIEEWAGER